MLRPLLLALVALLGSAPVTDDVLRSLSDRVASLERESVRSKRLRDAHDADRWLGPRSLSTPIGIRGSSAGGIPDLASPLMARLRDDAALAGLAAGRTDTFDGFANMLEDPAFEKLGAATTIGTSYTALGPEWKAKYVLNSGTVATTRTMGMAAERGGTGTSFLSSAICGLSLIFGVNAADMTIYLRPTTAVSFAAGVRLAPSWLVAAMRAFTYSHDNLTATAYLEIVDASDTVLASGDSDDLVNLYDLNEHSRLDVGYEEPANNTSYRFRLRVDVTKEAGSAASLVALFAEPLVAGSADGSVPAHTPAIGGWVPGAPGLQLVTLPFVLPNIPAGATTDLQYADNAMGMPFPRVTMPWGGWIVGSSYRMDGVLTGGTLDLQVLVTGSAVWTPHALTTSSANNDTATQGFVDAFASGDSIAMQAVTSGGFTPTTRDIICTLWLLVDFSV